MECGRTVSPCSRAHSTSELTSHWQETSTTILSMTPLFSGLFIPHDCLFIHAHRPSLFTLMQGRAGGGRSIFLMQNRVKKGHDFLFGGSFSLSHAICQSVVVFHPFTQRTGFPLALLSCVFFFHPSWWIVSCRPLCFPSMFFLGCVFFPCT